MWPDRRLIDLLQIEHPLVLAPMAGISTVELAASVCAAGGLGSIGCAWMQPELAAKTIQALRALTDKPINVNFFCHVEAKADADREQAWRDRLSPYYRELGIDPDLPHLHLERPERRWELPISSVLKQQHPRCIAMPCGMHTRTRPSLQTCSPGDQRAF
jgi:NAD(P)H-dependent flavin oxidoreductase YrpB (nitropropane dioxygenase family)